VPNTTNPDLLDSIAASISDGAEIQWEEVAGEVGGDSDAIVNQLRQLERIAKFYRDVEEPELADEAQGDKPSPGPRTWAHFLILVRLGGGSSGEVFRAHDTKLQCDVALKLIRHDGDSAARISRVLKEARLLARVRHSNVVAIYGADQLEGRVGLWMELVRGTTLEDLLQRLAHAKRRLSDSISVAPSPRSIEQDSSTATSKRITSCARKVAAPS
jgi:eukaryotic-like serine/threonine-protein kinase